jgi:hypothetical protein
MRKSEHGRHDAQAQQTDQQQRYEQVALQADITLPVS